MEPEIRSGDPAAARSPLEEPGRQRPDAILLIQPDGLIAEADIKDAGVFGVRPSDLIGRPVTALIPDWPARTSTDSRNNRRSSLSTPSVSTWIEARALRKNGASIAIDVMLIVPRAVSFSIAAVWDAAARRKAEEESRQREQQYHLLVDATRDYAIFMLDPYGFVKTWSAGAQRMKGYDASEILGRHFSVFYPEEDIQRGKPQHDLEIARAEGRYEDEGWRVRKDGSRFWANVIITALYNDKKELIGFSRITRDPTSRRKVEDTLFEELGSAMLSQLDVREMLKAISAGIQKILPESGTVILTLYDPATNQLCAHQLPHEGMPESDLELPLPLDGSPAGWVYRNQETLIADSLKSTDFPQESVTHLIARGLQSGCWVPMTARGKTTGVLFIGSSRESAFEHVDRSTLTQIASRVALALDNAEAVRQLSRLTGELKEQKRYLEEELRTEHSFDEIVGASPALRRVLRQVEMVAETDAAVLILGETGTGKELIARSIHNLSPRRDSSFVKINCSAIPAGLLESELFGHERGAFTGALAQRIGRLELANLGTLFLDEIGDLPLELQPKLLRALQEKEIERLGGKKTIPVDFRLIAATHHDLAKMVNEGGFRSDLYYRLKVFPILIPPLRQRTEDIPLLVNYFVAKHARRMNKHIETIPAEQMRALSEWRWPGNVRELENFLERAVILTNGPTLKAPLMELAADEDAVHPTGSSLEAKEREHILQVLREARGVIAGANGAAARLGLKRTTLNSKLKKLGIERNEYVPRDASLP